MKALKYLLVFLVSLAALLAVAGLFLPSAAQVERSIVIDAPRANVFTILNTPHRFNDFSPWAEMDPDAEYTFDGPYSGTGARMEWSSDEPGVGDGSQEIVESEPYEHIRLRLVFGPGEPATSYYRLADTDGGTEVTWGFRAEFGYDLVGRYMGLMFDSWVGSEYEKGLNNLKALAEQLPDTDVTGIRPELVMVDAVPLAAISGETATDDESISTALATGYGRLTQYLLDHGVEQAGPPRAITHVWDEENDRWRYTAALPVESMPERDPEEETATGVRFDAGYAGPAVRVVHEGAYADTGEIYEKLFPWVEIAGLAFNGDSWETYSGNPADTPMEELRTEIYVPIEMPE